MAGEKYSWGKGENNCDLRKKTQLKGVLENSHQHREVDRGKETTAKPVYGGKCKKRYSH